MRRIVAFAVAFAALTAFSAGCAADEAEEREAAYPDPVGYTPPGELAASEQRPAPPAAPPPDASPAPESGTVVGDGDEGDNYADTDPAALSDFHSALDPYGTWADDPTYGTVWVPSETVVGDDFSPYVSDGHWAYDDDYTWVSDYDWGWAPFHYGRWIYATNGWSWTPGRSYAGAWVSWRYGAGGYVGWAPRPPAWGWRGGVAVGLGFVPRMPYAFVANRDLFAPSVGGRLVAGPEARVVGAQTRPWIGASRGAGGMGGHLGPPPSVLNIAASAVVHTSVGNVGIAQARAFARPSTARALGAAAPRMAAERGPRPGIGESDGRASMRASVPAYGAASQSHFGGRLLGGGFAASGGAGPPVRSFSGSARPYFGAPGAGPAFSSSPAYRSSGGVVYGGASRSLGGASTFYGRSAPVSPGAGAYRSGGGGGAVGGGFHGGGGGGGTHAGGGGGGFHGGGRGGRR